MALLSSFGKEGIQLGLLTRKVDIEDTEYLSKYFVLSEFNPAFTAGKNAVSFNGSPLLKDKTEIQVECLDSGGNSLYLEQARSEDAQFTDAAKYVISIHVYDETYNGIGKLIFIGTTTKGEVVRWIGNITIDKTQNNVSKVRFFNKPTLEVRSLLYPVIDTDKAEVDYPPPPAVEVATATANIASYVDRIRVDQAGAGYTSVEVSVGGNATAHAIIGAGGSITEIIIDDPGSGYTSAPAVSISGEDETTPAKATAFIKSEVVSVTVPAGGSGLGYTFTPAVTFIPNGSGAGAEAYAEVTDGVVTNVVVTNGGDGYVKAPAVQFDIPDEPPAPELNIEINFSASFNTYAGNPKKDTNKNTIDFKQTDIDYRLMVTSSAFRELIASDFEPRTLPDKAFNSQMEGHTLILHIDRIQKPYTNTEMSVDITASIPIKKVLDSRTVQLTEPFFYAQGKNYFVSQIILGRCFLDYRFVMYNTSPDSSRKYNISSTVQVDVKESFAEISYRNLKCYSGFVARHKLYRKSSFYPGEFVMVSNELLGANEMLVDAVTFNKFYDSMGVFYHQPHINKYWFPSSDALTLQAVSNPIHGMKIVANPVENADGNEGVMVKTDTIGLTNDAIYYPYDSDEYNRLSGVGYNSNFVNLKKDALYVLSTNISVEKNANETKSKVAFYFTSSIESIKTEKSYDSKHGLKLGEIEIKDTVAVKRFNDKQYFYFTPSNDYYGTLVIVPYLCSPTLSEFSLKVYGDYGFSPEVQVIKIPFSVNVANEAFDIKAELLDINSNVVYSNLRAVQTFDTDGESLYASTGPSTLNSVNTVISITQNTPAPLPDVTITGVPYFPDLQNCDQTIRLVGWHIPTGDANDGKLCYTNIARLYVSSSDYITLHDYQTGAEQVAKAIAVQYDFANFIGRKIFVDATGTKEQFP